MKKDKRTKMLLKRLAAVRGRDRELMPRPTVFSDKTKYSRKREKQRLGRYSSED